MSTKLGYRVFRFKVPLVNVSQFHVQEVFPDNGEGIKFCYPHPAEGKSLEELEDDLLRKLEAVRRVKNGEQKLMEEQHQYAIEVEDVR